MKAIIFFLAISAAYAQAPLPELRVEPAVQSSILYIKDAVSQPALTAFLVELVKYPGSYYQLWEDGLVTEPIEPGAEKKIPISNMTVGAVPNYVHLTAAVYADGSTAGTPEKVNQLIGRRKALLATVKELIGKLEKAKSAGTSASALAGELKSQADGMKGLTKSTQNSQPAIDESAAKMLTAETAAGLESHSIDESIAVLKGIEGRMAASKPGL